MTRSTQRHPHRPRRRRPLQRQPIPGAWLAALAALTATLVWQYWSTIVDLAKDWQRDPNYSVGQLVPFVAIYMVWHQRDRLRRHIVKPSWILGSALILLAMLARLAGLALLFESGERYSMVLAIAGLVVLVAGWRIAWRLKWVLAFLLLMVPLPGRVHNLISGPLQGVATSGAVITLELFGVSVIREGNTLALNHDLQVAVAEACSGLRMLTAFIVVAATLASLINRPTWQRTVLILSSIPVAILCNVARLCITAALYLVTNSELAERFFHDFAGLTMMPLALAILVGEIALMNVLVIPDQPPDRQRPSPAPKPHSTE